MEKNGWIKKNGGWERAGVFYPGVARIKADTFLKSPEFRGIFHPGEMVYFCKNLIYKEETNPGEYLYLASIRSVDGDKSSCVPIPLGMLEFTPDQKKEILEFTKFPKSIFDKLHSMKHVVSEDSFFVQADDFFIEAEDVKDYYM